MTDVLKNTVLVVVSTLVTLLVLEGLLQAFYDPSRIYSNLRVLPEENRIHHEARFWRDHRRGETFEHTHDAQLGWDFDAQQDRIRGSRTVSLTPADDTLRVLAIGDSFTYGIDVEENETYSALLDGMDGIEALNMGIPGYGIDQAYLKYAAHGRQFQPDVIVFGIYVGDYERTALQFTFFAKPWFEVEMGTMKVAGQPIPTPEAEFARIAQYLENRIYLLEVLRNFQRKISVTEADRARFFRNTDAVVRHILQDLKENLSAQQTLLVVHIPRAEAFIESDDMRDEISRRLLALYEEVGIPYIDLKAAFTAEREPRRVYEEYYRHLDSGSVGHLNHAGHARVADLILGKLKEQGIPADIGSGGL